MVMFLSLLYSNYFFLSLKLQINLLIPQKIPTPQCKSFVNRIIYDKLLYVKKMSEVRLTGIYRYFNGSKIVNVKFFYCIMFCITVNKMNGGGSLTRTTS